MARDRGSVTISVPPVLMEKLDRLAKERGETRQVFVRRLIADECDRATRERERAEKLNELLHRKDRVYEQTLGDILS